MGEVKLVLLVVSPLVIIMGEWTAELSAMELLHVVMIRKRQSVLDCPIGIKHHKTTV